MNRCDEKNPPQTACEDNLRVQTRACGRVGRPPIRAACATLIAALLAVATGCGGSQPSDDPLAGYDVEANTTMTAAKPPLGKAEFVNRVNRACRYAWTRVGENWRRYVDDQDPGISRLARYARAVKSSFLYGIDIFVFDSIRQLGAPPGDERAIEEIIGPFQATVELGWMGRWRARSIPEVVSRFETFNERAARYGLDDCLVDGSHLTRLRIRG